MATQVDRYRTVSLGGASIHVLEATLITSGTTITFTFPILGKRILLGPVHHNRTTDVPAVGGTYDEATAVYVSPTMAVNDACTVTLVTD